MSRGLRALQTYQVLLTGVGQLGRAPRTTPQVQLLRTDHSVIRIPYNTDYGVWVRPYTDWPITGLGASRISLDSDLSRPKGFTQDAWRPATPALRPKGQSLILRSACSRCCELLIIIIVIIELAGPIRS